MILLILWGFSLPHTETYAYSPSYWDEMLIITKTNFRQAHYICTKTFHHATEKFKTYTLSFGIMFCDSSSLYQRRARHFLWIFLNIDCSRCSSRLVQCIDFWGLRSTKHYRLFLHQYLPSLNLCFCRCSWYLEISYTNLKLNSHMEDFYGTSSKNPIDQ
jgi:hypothetical protein